MNYQDMSMEEARKVIQEDFLRGLWRLSADMEA